MIDSNCAPRRRLPWQTAVLGLAFSAALMGCGSAKQGAVSGKVTYLGKPVRGGSLILSPVGEGNVGQPASAVIKPDGTFVVGTTSAADGAKIGKHHVTFTPPPQVLSEQQRSDPTYLAPPAPYTGMIAKQDEVEVKSGKNVIDIELTPRE